VQIAAGDQPIGADAAIGAACQAQHGAFEARSGGLSEVHFVARDRHPGPKLDAARPREAFGVRKHGLDVEQAEPGHCLFPSFDTERIGDALAEHLISTTNA
jgi:hypothetical protein